MAYQILECPVGIGKTLADILPYQDFAFSWKTGAKFSIIPPVPIKLTWNPENETGTKVSYYSVGVVLMRKDLLKGLADAGVDNLDTYEVVIHSNIGSEDCHDYRAVNIIGAITAANMEKSGFLDESDGMFDVVFESLVIDEEKAKGMLLFRLAESVSTVVIHEDVVAHLKRVGGFGLTFTDPEEYCG